MSSEHPETVFCFFRVASGSEQKLIDLQEEHVGTLRRLGFATASPATLYQGQDELGRPFLVKLFEWRSGAALEAARQHPEVQALWEAMEPLCEPRDGRPSMEFPHVEVRVL